MFSTFLKFATGNFARDATLVYHCGKIQYVPSDGVCLCELDCVIEYAPEHPIRLPFSCDANRILKYAKGLKLVALPDKKALLIDDCYEWAFTDDNANGLLAQPDASFACREIVLPKSILRAHKPDWFNVYPKCTRLVNDRDNYKHFIEVPHDVKLRNEEKVNLNEAIYGVQINPLYLWDFVGLFLNEELVTIRLSLRGPVHVIVGKILHFFMAPFAHD